MSVFQITKLKSNMPWGYILACLLVVVVFFANKIPSSEIINSESCVGVSCAQIIENPSISDKVTAYFINDIFQSDSNEYYRLVFQEKSNQDTKINIKIATPIDEMQEIGSVDVKKSEKYNFHELFFASRGKYSDLIFEKENKNDGADVSIIGAQISKLNISSEKEFVNFIPTIKGDTDFSVIDQQQTDKSNQFYQLSNPRMTFGQVFRANADYITKCNT